MQNYIDSTELIRSRRLGITYKNISYKFLTCYNTDEEVKSAIRSDTIRYEVEYKDLGEDFSEVELTIQSMKYDRKFFFKNGKLVDSFLYYSQNWTTIKSKYFIFKVSDRTQMNNYCFRELDSFVDSTCNLLKISLNEREELEKNKFYYFLCKNRDEFDSLSEIRSKGYFSADYDEIITCYNTHYHEVAHALIVYKLREQDYYVHPFFREGFATAIGGTQPIHKEAAFDIALMIFNQGETPYDSLLTMWGFWKYDFAGLAYPLCGFYNKFLLNVLDIDDYLKLYRKVSGSYDYTAHLIIDSSFLPERLKFNEFLANYSGSLSIKADTTSFTNSSLPTLSQYGEHYIISMNGILLFSPYRALIDSGYSSTSFTDIFDDKKYDNEMYCIIAKNDKLQIVNLYTNEILATYFEIHLNKTDIENSRRRKYVYSIRKDIFEGDLLKDFKMTREEFEDKRKN